MSASSPPTTAPPAAPAGPRTKVQLLRHQCSFLHGDLARYFNRPTFSDLSIVSPDGRKIFCHQAVLCAASPRLAQTLEPGTLTGEELPVWGVDSDALHAVLRFFYTGEATLTFATAAPLCDAAQRLEVTSLAQHCQAFLADVLHPSTVVAIYRQAVTLRMDELQAQCLHLMCRHLDLLAADPDFLQLEPPLLLRVLATCKPYVLGPAALLAAAWAWVTANPSAHVAYVEELLRQGVLVPPEGMGVQELVTLGMARQPLPGMAPLPLPPGTGAADAPAAAPAPAAATGAPSPAAQAATCAGGETATQPGGGGAVAGGVAPSGEPAAAATAAPQLTPSGAEPAGYAAADPGVSKQLGVGFNDPQSRPLPPPPLSDKAGQGRSSSAEGVDAAEAAPAAPAAQLLPAQAPLLIPTGGQLQPTVIKLEAQPDDNSAPTAGAVKADIPAAAAAAGGGGGGGNGGGGGTSPAMMHQTNGTAVSGLASSGGGLLAPGGAGFQLLQQPLREAHAPGQAQPRHILLQTAGGAGAPIVIATAAQGGGGSQQQRHPSAMNGALPLTFLQPGAVRAAADNGSGSGGLMAAVPLPQPQGGAYAALSGHLPAAPYAASLPDGFVLQQIGANGAMAALPRHDVVLASSMPAAGRAPVGVMLPQGLPHPHQPNQQQQQQQRFTVANTITLPNGQVAYVTYLPAQPASNGGNGGAGGGGYAPQPHQHLAHVEHLAAAGAVAAAQEQQRLRFHPHSSAVPYQSHLQQQSPYPGSATGAATSGPAAFDNNPVAAPAMASGGGGAGAGSFGGGFNGIGHALKGVCQVDGCYADLTGLRDYHLRYKICDYHLKVCSIMRDGRPQRFCQQCGRFHDVSEFDNFKRSCRARLERHNQRRRKRQDADDAGGGGGGGDGAGSPASGGSGRGGQLPAKRAAYGGGLDAFYAPHAEQDEEYDGGYRASDSGVGGASGGGRTRGGAANGLDILAAAANQQEEELGGGQQQEPPPQQQGPLQQQQQQPQQQDQEAGAGEVTTKAEAAQE